MSYCGNDFSIVPIIDIHAKETVGIENSVAAQIDKFIASVGKGVTPSNAANQMLSHALYGRGKTLNANINSPITAAILKSEMTRHMLVYTSTRMVEQMEGLGRTKLWGYADASWYHYGNYYNTKGYFNEQMTGDSFLQVLAGSYLDHININDKPYGANEYDNALSLVVGGSRVIFTVTRTSISNGNAKYKVDVIVKDRFDANNGKYDAATEKGYDTTTDNLVNLLGSTVGKLLFREYDWTSSFSYEAWVKVYEEFYKKPLVYGES